MDKIYGAPPVDLGLIDLSPVEMMAWLYCPIKIAKSQMLYIPENLRQFHPIINAVVDDLYQMDGLYYVSYIYITAKTLWVTADNPGNRPGWHSDGFMTDDLNYVWSDRNGTLFWEPAERVSFTQDHTASLKEMEICESGPHKIYPDKHLLRLDQSVMHRVADVKQAGMRSFVKVSVSQHVYNLAGNSINHKIGPLGTYVARTAERNPPISEKAGAS
jgi:hypothetical protein